MGDWANRTFELLKAKEGSEHLRIQHEVMARHQTLIEAPDRWRELQEVLAGEIQDFNRLRPGHLAIADMSDEMLFTSPKCSLEVSFSREHPKITYAVKERRTPSSGPATPAHGTFSFAIKDEKVWPVLEVGRGTAPFDKTATPLTITEVAEFLLDKLI